MSDYWKNRHLKYKGSIRAVAHQGLSDEANQEDYQVKRDTILAILQDRLKSDHTAWDAGCGSGHLFIPIEPANLYLNDVSAVALDQARDRLSVPKTNTQDGPISQVRWPHRMNWVYCFDVLYHVLDDGEWQKSVENLLAHASSGVLIQEHLEDVPGNPNVHIRTRTLQMYQELAETLGWEISGHKRYTLPRSGSQLDLILFSRAL